jgi:hypothetical protein
MIQHLKREHRVAIKAWQPYRRGNLGRDSSLFLLHELNNADKHRLLQVLGGKAGAYFVGASWGDGPLPDYRIWGRTVLEDGAQVGEVSTRWVRSRQVQLEQGISPYIAFWLGCDAVRGLGVVATLARISERVEEIVESFAEAFD